VTKQSLIVLKKRAFSARDDRVRAHFDKTFS